MEKDERDLLDEGKFLRDRYFSEDQKNKEN